MGTPIIPRITRGRLFYQTAAVLFPSFPQVTTAWPELAIRIPQLRAGVNHG